MKYIKNIIINEDSVDYINRNFCFSNGCRFEFSDGSFVVLYGREDVYKFLKHAKDVYGVFGGMNDSQFFACVFSEDEFKSSSQIKCRGMLGFGCKFGSFYNLKGYIEVVRIENGVVEFYQNGEGLCCVSYVKFLSILRKYSVRRKEKGNLVGVVFEDDYVDVPLLSGFVVRMYYSNMLAVKNGRDWLKGRTCV